MIRLSGGLAMLLAAALLVSAGDDPIKPEEPLKKVKKNTDPVGPPKLAVEEKKDDKDEGLKKLNKLDRDPTKPPQAGGKGEDPREVLARIAKNMEASEDRLKKKDPGTETQRIQDEILKDLDKLIQQQDEQNNKNNSSSSSSSSSSSNSSSSSSRRNRSGRSQSGSTAKKPGTGNQQVGTGQKPEPNKETGSKPGQQGTASTGGQGGDSKEKKNTLADLFPDVWGHLPEAKKQEMDAYMRERFMARYEELLKQYYRTISERSRQKEKE